MLVDQIATTQPGPDARPAFKRLLALWAAAHPVGRCREGAATSLLQLDAVWPPSTSAPLPAAALRSLQPCEIEFEGAPPPLHIPRSISDARQEVEGRLGGRRAGRPRWSACRGSTPDSRGFTCGLWMLFHATAARCVRLAFCMQMILPFETGRVCLVTAAQSAVSFNQSTNNQSDHPPPNDRLPDSDGQLLMTALEGFAKHFFMCTVRSENCVNFPPTTASSICLFGSGVHHHTRAAHCRNQTNAPARRPPPLYNRCAKSTLRASWRAPRRRQLQPAKMQSCGSGARTTR
jgi:hypothetical protein